MCGICGIVHRDASSVVDVASLERMNSALVHRGPDDAGLWVRENAGLAMRRLKVIDLIGGRQPMSSGDGSVALVFNGEIYNYRELRLELEQRGCTFTTQSDTEVLLRAYESWGIECLARLNGMFAFAVHDAARNETLLVRDRLGIKPLHYTVANGCLYFASELPALLAGLPAQPPLNAHALDAYFEFLYIPAPDTVYHDVFKVRPGEFLRFTQGGITAVQYWQPAYAIDSRWTLETAGERYLELLTDAVKMQQVSDVPLGAFLSGGVDSSGVVGVLARCSDAPVKTFSIGFDDREANELEFARIAANQFGTRHTETVIHPDLVSLCPAIAAHFGEPFGDSSALPTWFVSQVAREQVTVALSGDGGDELFAGYAWTMMNRRVAQYRRAPRLVQSAVSAGLSVMPSTPWFEKVRRFCNDAALPPLDSFRRRLGCFTRGQRESLLGPGVRCTTDSERRDRFAEHASAAALLSGDDRMLYLDTAQYLPDDILTKVDRMSMAHSLEVRVPILDHRIVEFAATVPFELKLHRGITKRLVKHALRTVAPPELLQQRKQGFSLPIHRWFREDLAPVFAETVLSGQARCRDFADVSFARRLFEDHIRRRENYGHHLWALLMLEHWLRA